MFIIDLPNEIIRYILNKTDNNSIINIIKTSLYFNKLEYDKYLIPYFIFNKTFHHSYEFFIKEQISDYLYNYYSFRSYLNDLINAIDNLIYYNTIKSLNIVKKKERFYFYIDPFTIQNYYCKDRIKKNKNINTYIDNNNSITTDIYDEYNFGNMCDNYKTLNLHNIYRVNYNIYFKYIKDNLLIKSLIY